MTKNFVCRTPYPCNHLPYDCHLWYTCVKWYLQAVFVGFFRILILWVVKGRGRARNGLKWKSYLLLSKSQEPYIIWLSFMLCICKMIISPGAFLSFLKILIFRVTSGVKGQNKEKKWSKMTKKICPPHSISQEPHMIWMSFMVH